MDGEDEKAVGSGGEVAEMEREIEEMKATLKLEQSKNKDITRMFLRVLGVCVAVSFYDLFI